MGLDIFIYRARKYDNIHSAGLVERSFVGDMRKCNQAFGYFREIGLAGHDSQEIAQIFPDEIEGLITRAEAVLADHSKAKKLLPRESGFFFGSDKYDDGYFHELERVVEQCRKSLDGYDPSKQKLYLITYY